MPYSLAIFDLDGTLVDSFPWFRRTINDVADRFGFRRVAGDELETIRAKSTREILAHLQLRLWKVPASRGTCGGWSGFTSRQPPTTDCGDGTLSHRTHSNDRRHGAPYAHADRGPVRRADAGHMPC